LIPLIEHNSGLLPLLDYTAGALFSLIEAERHDFRDRPQPCPSGYLEEVVAAVGEMRDGRIPQSGLWIAGCHVNSALVRIAASYDRAVATLKRKNRSMGQRISSIPPEPKIIGRIREEVNSLKHEVDANSPGRDVQFDEALGGMEELLDFIERCVV
jgi:hypothetical protein